MRRWLESPLFLMSLALAIHLCVLGAVKLFVPPLVYYGKSDPTALPAPLILPLPEPPNPAESVPERDLFGEKIGEGDSVASIDLPDQSQSETPHDFEQAWLRQKPVVEAQMSPQQSSEKSAALVPSGLQTELPAMSPRQVAKGQSTVEAPIEKRPTDDKASDGTASDGERGDDQKTYDQPRANAAEPNPAPQGQSDVDPFAKAEGISLVGGVKARQGREIKFSRPRVDLAFRAEFTRLAKRRMEALFRITTDASGRPRNIEILRSSGSEQIDESLRLALFDSWFGGKMPDEFPFAIRFYDDD
jgi:hypothetical protein